MDDRVYLFTSLEFRGGLHSNVNDKRSHLTVHIFDKDNKKIAALHVPYNPEKKVNPFQ